MCYDIIYLHVKAMHIIIMRGDAMPTIRKLGDDSKLGAYGKKSRVEKDYNNSSVENPPGVLAIWLQLLLMYLPIVGWIFTLHFAISNNSTVARKNLARATIINKVILLLIFAIIYFAISSMLSSISQTLNGLLEKVKNTYEGTQSISDTLEKVINYINKFNVLN